MIKEKYDAEPYTPKFGELHCLKCPQCGYESLHIEKTTFSLRQFNGLNIEPEKPDKWHVTDGIIEVTHEADDSGGYSYQIKHYYTCEEGHKGIIELQHHEGSCYLVHRAIKPQNEVKT